MLVFYFIFIKIYTGLIWWPIWKFTFFYKKINIIILLIILILVILFIFRQVFFCCTKIIYWEQKARATYEKLIDLCRDNPEVLDPLRYLRAREVVHFQRFGEALRGVQDKLAERKFYMNDMNNCNNN